MVVVVVVVVVCVCACVRARARACVCMSVVFKLFPEKKRKTARADITQLRSQTVFAKGKRSLTVSAVPKIIHTGVCFCQPLELSEDPKSFL